jgi:hypothetical protein
VGVSEREPGRGPRKILKFALVLLCFSVVSLHPRIASEGPAPPESQAITSAGTGAAPEPGTLLLLGAGIIAVAYQWKFRAFDK